MQAPASSSKERRRFLLDNETQRQATMLKTDALGFRHPGRGAKDLCTVTVLFLHAAGVSDVAETFDLRARSRQ